jgi:hypothetical protein
MKAILAIALVALLAAACSPSAYRHHTLAVGVVAGAHEVGGGLVDDARAAALDAVQAEHPAGEARNAALDAEAGRWLPAGDALDAVRSALLTWLAGLEMARVADDEDGLLEALLPLAARVLALYDDAARLLRELGVEAPELPDAVRAVIGGAS